jgi:membrane-associated protein
MEILGFLIDFILNVDRYLEIFTQQYGAWVYVLLFLIIFFETGVVIMPFLPGDSLLFVVGTLCGAGFIDYKISVVVLLIASILGDQCNYTIGRYFGPRVFQWDDSRFFKRRYLIEAEKFYARHGPLAIVIARFLPFIRTFIPFVAGMASMNRSKFILFNIVGAAIWVFSMVSMGYFLGNLPGVRKHFEYVIWGFILVPGLVVIAQHSIPKLRAKYRTRTKKH